MPLLDVEDQLLVVQKVGDVDPVTGDPVVPTSQGTTGVVMANIGLLWAKYSQWASTSPTLRELLVARECVDLVIGVLERLVDFSIDGQDAYTLRVSLSQRVKARQAQRQRIEERILRVLKTLGLSTANVGLITQQVPITPPLPGDRPTQSVFGPDANSPVYGGSPYWRRGYGPGSGYPNTGWGSY